MYFSDLTLPDAVRQGIADAGFSECTPIQEQSLPIALTGRDVAGQAQTGTGKTAAFLVALFTRLLGRERSGDARTPRALILAPTRELVVQIEQDAQTLGAHCGFSIQAIYGGVDYMLQKNALKDGADVVIGTPGRLIDYLKQKVYSLGQIEMLVIDEADRMFDMGFIADLRFILRRLPSYDKRQNMMFSATLNQRVMELAYEFMNLPEKVAVTPNQLTAERITQVMYHVGRKEKFGLLLGLLRKEGMARTMIFVNTKREAEFLFDRLNANDFPSKVLSGDVEQRKRLKILDDFRLGRLPIMIATDVASRGLHIDEVSHVINYDIPQDAEDYVHRIGRTARAGADGKAISLADEDGAFFIEPVVEYIRMKIPVEWADDDLIVKDYVRVRPKPRVAPAKPTRDGARGGRSGSSSSSRKPALRVAAAPAVAKAAEPLGEGDAAKKKRRRRRKKPAGEAGTAVVQNPAGQE
jgi:ATP-dependent RNA helicase RhlB